MENQRIRVSKTMLEGALMRLLREKQVDKVTVYELCQEAGINRTTFYKYYGSPQDLLDQIIAEMLAQFEQALAEDFTHRSGTHHALAYLASEQERFRTVIASVPEGELLDKVSSLWPIRNVLDQMLSGPMTDSERDYARLFFCQGGYAIIRKWLQDGCPQRPEELTRMKKQALQSRDGNPVAYRVQPDGTGGAAGKAGALWGFFQNAPGLNENRI